jgi:hypothetical protein
MSVSPLTSLASSPLGGTPLAVSAPTSTGASPVFPASPQPSSPGNESLSQLPYTVSRWSNTNDWQDDFGDVYDDEEWTAQFEFSRPASPVLDYDGEPLVNIERSEPAEAGDYDRVSHEENALRKAREALYVYEYDLIHVVTSNSPHAPTSAPPPPRTARPPLTWETAHLPHWMDHFRPHLAFLPLQRNFGGLLKVLYWSEDPTKMLERYDGSAFRGRKMYRVKNADDLRMLYYQLRYAARTLESHVYPPSMRGKIKYLSQDLIGQNCWMEGMDLAMHYGRRDVTRVLEAVGVLSMMISLSRQQTGT